MTEFEALIKEKDIRKITYFIYYFGRGNDLDEFDPSNINSSIKMANDIYDRDRLDEYDIKDFIFNLNNNLLPKDNFDWLSDELACAFCWGMLASRLKFNIIGVYSEVKWLSDLNISENTFSHKERYKNIKRFFDEYVIYNDKPISSDYDCFKNKEELMEWMRNEWVINNKKVKEIKWLDINDERICKWMWNYIERYDNNEAFLRRDRIDTLHLFSPNSGDEYYFSIYGVLRSWNCHSAIKKQLINDATRAYKQSVYRKKREGKKTLNCDIDASVKEHLDELSKVYDMTIVDLITKLIEDEYKLDNKSKKS
ncbi:hypothetical protein AAD041_01790 [Proteus mirabilis]|uniref:hypothetical protein n=1 Tax=Proteus TaxID=583 RepID=UPI0032DB6824